MKSIKIKRSTTDSLICYGLALVAFIYCMVNMTSMSNSLRGQLVPICAYVVLAVSLNLVVGISGELSLGHAGFMSIGAFSGVVISAWLASGLQLQSNALNLIITLIVSGLITGVFGALIGIPVLRLRGDYLAIVTLAFCEIIKEIIKLVYVGLDGRRLIVSDNLKAISGEGVRKLLLGPQPTTPGKTTFETIAKIDRKGTYLTGFIIGFALVIFTLFIVLNLINSRSGRAIKAARDNRIAAESMGINVTKYKMMAFVTGATLAGMAGALYTLNIGSIDSTSFGFNKSIEILLFVVLGGIGNIWGSMIAAVVLTLLPEALRSLNLDRFRLFTYAILLIAIMLITNNAVIRSFFGKFAQRRRGIEAAEGKGGAAE